MGDVKKLPKTCKECEHCATFPNPGLKHGICNDLHFFDNLLKRRHKWCPLEKES